MRDVSRSSRSVARVAMDAVASGRSCLPDENVSAYGEIVWFWRPDAGVKFCGKARRAMVARKPVTRESTL